MIVIEGTSMRTIAVAACSLDPPGGGAERSLCTLINGLLIPGPAFEEHLSFHPLLPTNLENIQNLEEWNCLLYTSDAADE